MVFLKVYQSHKSIVSLFYLVIHFYCRIAGYTSVKCPFVHALTYIR